MGMPGNQEEPGSWSGGLTQAPRPPAQVWRGGAAAACRWAGSPAPQRLDADLMYVPRKEAVTFRGA